MNLDCSQGGHRWFGTGICSCGARLRCGACGCFIREDRIQEHARRCPVLEAWHQADIAEIRSRLG